MSNEQLAMDNRQWTICNRQKINCRSALANGKQVIQISQITNQKSYLAPNEKNHIYCNFIHFIKH